MGEGLDLALSAFRYSELSTGKGIKKRREKARWKNGSKRKSGKKRKKDEQAGSPAERCGW